MVNFSLPTNSFSSTETLLKKRWKHLKDQYRKELKKTPYFDENCDQVHSWIHFNSMDFIRSEMLPIKRRDQSRSESDDEDIQSESDAQATTTSASTENAENALLKHVSKRIFKVSGLVEKHIRACEGDARKDPDYMFLMSILSSMKKLTEIQKLEFRGKINDWLLEVMTSNEYNGQSDNESKYFLQSQLEVECTEGGESNPLSE